MCETAIRTCCTGLRFCQVATFWPSGTDGSFVAFVSFISCDSFCSNVSWVSSRSCRNYTKTKILCPEEMLVPKPNRIVGSMSSRNKVVPSGPFGPSMPRSPRSPFSPCAPIIPLVPVGPGMPGGPGIESPGRQKSAIHPEAPAWAENQCRPFRQPSWVKRFPSARIL